LRRDSSAPPAPGQCVDERGDGVFEMFEPAIKLGIIAPVFDEPARMSDGGRSRRHSLCQVARSAEAASPLAA